MKAEYPNYSLAPIVIVDDSDEDICVLRHRLREAEITNPLLTFHAPAELLAFLRAAGDGAPLPACVFTELRLPAGDGFELIETIRGTGWAKNLPIAVMTYSNRPAELKRALELGVNSYMIKFPPAARLGRFIRQGAPLPLPDRREVHALCA